MRMRPHSEKHREYSTKGDASGGVMDGYTVDQGLDRVNAHGAFDDELDRLAVRLLQRQDSDQEG